MQFLPKKTRGEIVVLLKRKDGMVASEIANELDLHSMIVRQHLAILEREGYVRPSLEKMRRGRPTHVII